jgi:hypothetical protein
MGGERDPLRAAPKGFYRCTECSIQDPATVTGAVADTFATPAEPEAARANAEKAQRIDGEEALLNFSTHRRGYIGQVSWPRADNQPCQGDGWDAGPA